MFHNSTEQRSGIFWFTGKNRSRNPEKFPYINRNPEFWWKPYPQLDIKRTIWKGLSVKTRNKKQEEKRN